MQVKNILIDVMRMVGRPDAAEECEGDGQLSVETERMQRALLLCLNAVTDELARGYFPLKDVQSLSSQSGEYSYSSFEHTPYRIVRVTSDGKKVRWSAEPLSLVCDSKSVEVEYEYVPDALGLSDEFSYPDSSVGVALVSYGVAAEYMLIAGEVESAEMWESKYRSEIGRQLSLSPVRGRVPPRRWL